MGYFYTPKLIFPLKSYHVNSYKFHERCSYDGIYWGIHLGEDCNKKTGTPVLAIGRGRVVYASFHPGSSEKGNWGNILIIAHKNPINKKVFFSLYGHLGKILVKKGEKVDIGHKMGDIAGRNTPEGGWWPESHLHFAIYTGKWKGLVLPGYYLPEQHRTELELWENPSSFIGSYRK